MKHYVNMDNEENFAFRFSSIPYSPKVPPHFHNCYEILYFEKGDAAYLVEGNTYNLSEGDILITNPREMHCPVFKSNKTYQRSIIFLKPPYLSDFITEKYNPFSALENRKIGTQNRIDTKIVKQYELDKKFAAIKNAKDDMPEKELIIKTNLLQFLISINNIVSADEHTASNDKINEIIQFINQNLTSHITLDLLSEKFYLNKYYISHMFAEKTGITISKYITNKRILFAKEKLLEKTPVTQVYQAVGFSDYSSFYRAFKKTLGASPSSISKACLKNTNV
jgi:AraC-like DNA-binding protein